jgi:hypothetical protein
MKYLKVIFAIFIIAIALNLNAQTNWGRVTPLQGDYPKVVMSITDSATIYYTQYVDVSDIDNQTIYGYWYFAGGSSDSVKIWIQGFMNDSIKDFNVDTLAVVKTQTKYLGQTILEHLPCWKIRLKVQSYASGGNDAVWVGGGLTFGIYTKQKDLEIQNPK